MNDRPWCGSDPAEQPIPLTSHPEEPDGREQHPLTVADEARRIVLESQAAISREETDPALPLWTPATVSDPDRPSLWAAPVGRWAAALLVVACIAMFAAGWLQAVPGPAVSTGVVGATPAEGSMPLIGPHPLTAAGVEL